MDHGRKTLDKAEFAAVVQRANLAPSIHNAQPARWRMQGDTIEIAAELQIQLPQADPQGEGIALSVGAAVEATVLALGNYGLGAEVTTHWAEDDRHTWPRHRLAARLTLRPGTAQPLADQLEQRFTWRGSFADEVPQLYGWSRDDTRLAMDPAGRAEIAALNDAASLNILRRKAFRQELMSWMRLKPGHPRYQYDGLSAQSLRLSPRDVKSLKLGFGPLWRFLDLTGRTAELTAEARFTQTAPIIALFHADTKACPIDVGRAYLRMLLEASKLGFAAWPMTALTDEPSAAAEVTARYPIGPDRRLWQVVRLGKPTGPIPPRHRRPTGEIVHD